MHKLGNGRGWLFDRNSHLTLCSYYIYCEIRSRYWIASCLVTPQKFCSCSHHQSAGQVNSSPARCPYPGVQISLAKFCRNKPPTLTPTHPTNLQVNSALLEKINFLSSLCIHIFAMQIFRALQLSNREHKLDILDKCLSSLPLSLWQVQALNITCLVSNVTG